MCGFRVGNGDGGFETNLDSAAYNRYLYASNLSRLKSKNLIWLLLLVLGAGLGLTPENLSGRTQGEFESFSYAVIRETPPALPGLGNGLCAEIVLSFESEEDEDESHDNKLFSEGLFTFNSHIQNQAYTIRRLVPVDVWKRAAWLQFHVLRL